MRRQALLDALPALLALNSGSVRASCCRLTDKTPSGATAASIWKGWRVSTPWLLLLGLKRLCAGCPLGVVAVLPTLT